MPTKYKYQEVQDIFTQNECSLISEEYKNQLGKLEYTAICGHKNVTTLKQFIIGVGRKCKNCAFRIPSYDDVAKTFSDKNCKLIMSREDFATNYKNNNSKIKFMASCGHENNVKYANFTSLNQGINCPKCVNKNTAGKLKEFRTGENRNSLLQEFKCIEYFKQLIETKYITKKLFDGCKADIAIKTFEDLKDLWLGIQVKTTIKKTEREQYYFRLNSGKYENCLLLCICDEDKKMWLIPYDDVKGFKTIGVAKKSKYNKYEVNTENLFEKLEYYYNLINKFEYDVINTPTSKSVRQEQEYCNIRKNKIKCIDFTPNNMEGIVYDFMIGSKKVQEKVGTIMHNNINSYQFHLEKYDCRVNGKCKKKSYECGDNDLYWLNCHNGSFYVIPEDVLFKNGYIGQGCGRSKLYLSLTNSHTEWANNYLFNYDDLDEERFLKIVM